MSVEKRLMELGIQLPPPPQPVATYVPTVRVGNLLFVSGHGPVLPDGSLLRGRVGEDLALPEAQDAARLTGLAILASVRAALGSLDRVKRLVKSLGMVNAVDSFEEHPEVLNGFADLMAELFGPEAGIGARSAVGMASLPRGIPVEIEAIFEVE
jgi:enamine deaminase RidA (YjgF/YER057c/UK114 family)